MSSSADLSPLFFRPAGAKTDQSMCDSFSFVGAVAVRTSGVVHGRGLVATRNIQPGECLFVTPPTVSADVGEVYRVWSGGNGKKTIEDVAEASLLKNMRRCIKAKDKAVASSFMALTSAHCEVCDDELDTSLDILLGKCKSKSELAEEQSKRANNKDVLMGIIRHNAFGPDYHNYGRMEQSWTSASSSNDHLPYGRVLGMYPLAAIINHSCSSNAVRVFSGEIMAVHANQNIQEGEEIVWSYIPPAQPYHKRQELISGKFGFCCECKRCILDRNVLESTPQIWDELKTLDGLNETSLSTERSPNTADLEDNVITLENLLGDKTLSNEASRSLRLGYMNAFISYFNTALSSGSDRGDVLSFATQLHFAFVSFHNASTEHLSTLHLCYELAAAISAASTSDDEKSKAAKKTAFWTEQLKRAHQVRYGSLGNDISSVREAMKHTRCVLRNLDGLQKSRWGFI